MCLKGQHQIFGIHSTSVVGHTDHILATAFNGKVDAGGSGIDGVFQKLFDNACRSLNHLASSDLVHNGSWQSLDLTHDDSGPVSPHFIGCQRPVSCY